MDAHLIVMDKHPRVKPVDVGETWWQMMDKCMLKLSGQEAKEACRT